MVSWIQLGSSVTGSAIGCQQGLHLSEGSTQLDILRGFQLRKVSMSLVPGTWDSGSKMWVLRKNLSKTSIPKDSGRSYRHSYDPIWRPWNHFCHILLIKWVSKYSPDSAGRKKKTLPLGEGRKKPYCESTWRMEHMTSATSGKDKVLQSHVEMFQSNRISTKRSTFTTPNTIIQVSTMSYLNYWSNCFPFSFLTLRCLQLL